MVSSKFEIQNNSFGDDILSQGLEGHEIILWHSLNNLQIIYPTKICTNYSSGQWVVKIISIKKYYFEKIILERHVALKIICQNIRDQINTLMTLWQVDYKKHFLQIPSWKWKLCRSAFRRCSSNLRFKTTTEQTDMDFQQTCCDSSGTLNLIHLCASVCVCQTGSEHWYALRNSMITRYATSNTIAGCTWL